MVSTQKQVIIAQVMIKLRFSKKAKKFNLPLDFDFYFLDIKSNGRIIANFRKQLIFFHTYN